MILLALLSCTAAPPASAPAGPGDDVAAERLPDVDATEPGAAVFRDDVVHTIDLTLGDAARDALAADPTTYVEATFGDGSVERLVGVRLKGSTSFQTLDGKPNLRVSFDHFVDGQRHDGLEALDLVSEVEDPAAMQEALAYRLFRAAGQPASRTGFAWVRVDGEDYGLYTLVEKKDDVLLRRWWPEDADGSLYESSTEAWPCDLDDDGAPRCDCWEQDEVGADDTRADLEALCAIATDEADEAWRDAVDDEAVLGHLAMEMAIDAYDHYAGYRGNVYLYHPAESGAWALLPASMNSAFGSQRYSPGSCGTSGRVPTDFAGGLLARRCWADATCAADLQDQLRDAADTIRSSDVLATLDAWEALLGPYAAADPRAGYAPDAFATHVACLRDWLEARPAALEQLLPAACLGDGPDLDVAGWADLSTNGLCGRDAPDAVSYTVAGVDGPVLALARAPLGIDAGDEVVVLVTAGEDAGTWVLAGVVTVGADTLTLDAAPGLAGHLLVQRVPRYTSVRVRDGAVLTGGAWDGATGGLLALRVDGALAVEAGGQLSVAGLGYAGGPTGPAYNWDGYAGESWSGPGIGGASSGDGYNEANGAWAANGGGGGCNVGAGGGEHAGGATGAASWNGTATAPAAGEPYGDAARLAFGSGGGGVVNLGGASGPGGAGGGALFVVAGSVVVEGEIVAAGEDATAWAQGTWTYGAGGGAGGTVRIEAPTLTLAAGALRATGGAGYAAVDVPGGAGGDGRVHVVCDTVNGRACGEAAFDGLAEPAPTLGR